MSEARQSVLRAAEQGPSVEQITAARNSAIGKQQAMAAPDSQRVADELENAHKDALNIKARHDDSDALQAQVQASSGQEEGAEDGGLMGAAKSVAQTVTNLFSGGADTTGGGDGSAVGQQESGDQGTKDSGSMSHLIGTGRAIPTPVEPTAQRHLGDDEPDMPSASEQAAMRAQLEGEPASLGEGMSHSHSVGEVGAGANSVETASRVSHGLVDTVKGAMSSLFTGPSPPAPGTDASDAVRETLGDLPVGDDTTNTPADKPTDTPVPDTEAMAAHTSAGAAASDAMDRASAAAEAPRQERMGLPELLAQVVTNVAKNVGIATSQEELLAGPMSPEPDVPEAPAGSAAQAVSVPGDAGAGDVSGAVRGAADEAGARASEAAADAKERVKDAAADIKDKAGEAGQAAKDKTSGAADAAKDTAQSAADQARGAAESAKDTVGSAVESAKGAAQDAKDTVGSAYDSARQTAQDAKESVGGALESMKERTSEVAEGAVDTVTDTARSVQEKAYGAADTAKDKSSNAADAARDTAGSVTERAAGAAAAVKDTAYGAAETVKDKASGAADAAKEKASGAADAAKEKADDASKRDQDQGSGKGVLARAWDELKHGGGKAPRAVTQGETEAPQDVTSNQERSKHLDDPTQKRIYEGEAYKVSPGSQASDDQKVTDQQREKVGGVVAGDKRQVTGAVPHGKPEGPAPATGSSGPVDRFKAGGGAYSGFGTGSAAPRRGNDDIKRVQALFYPPTDIDEERPMTDDPTRTLNRNNAMRRTPALMEGAGDGSGMGRDQPSDAGEGSDVEDEEIPVSPAGLLGAVWGRSWVAKAAGPKTERFRPADVPYDPEADARNDAEARAAYDHARQTTYGRSSNHHDQHGDTSHASASEAAKAGREDLREAGKHAAESAAYTRDALSHGVDTAKKAAQEEAEAVRDQVGKAVSTAQHKAQNAKQAVRGSVEQVADKTRESAEAAAETLRQQKESVAAAVRSTAGAAREKAAYVADEARDTAHHLAESAEDVARRTRDRVADTAHSAEDAARRARERVSETADDVRRHAYDTADEARRTAHETAQEARRRAANIKDTVTTDAERAAEEARDRASRAGAVLKEEAQETKRAASAGFSSIGDAFKGLLSGLLSPFEREAAPMDERMAAVHAGTPISRSSEPIPEEQMTPEDRIKLNASRHYATKEYMNRAADPTSSRSDDAQVRDAEGRSLVGMVVEGAHDLKERAKGRAEELAEHAREGYERGEERIKRAVDEDKWPVQEVKERAAGVISRLEETLENVTRTVTDVLQDFVESDTQRVWTAPPSNTQDVLRMRQQRKMADQGMDRQVDSKMGSLADQLRELVEGRDQNDMVYVMPVSNTEDVLKMRAQVDVNDKLDRRFF